MNVSSLERLPTTHCECYLTYTTSKTFIHLGQLFVELTYNSRSVKAGLIIVASFGPGIEHWCSIAVES